MTRASWVYFISEQETRSVNIPKATSIPKGLVEPDGLIFCKRCHINGIYPGSFPVCFKKRLGYAHVCPTSPVERVIGKAALIAQHNWNYRIEYRFTACRISTQFVLARVVRNYTIHYNTNLIKKFLKFRIRWLQQGCYADIWNNFFNIRDIF